MAQGIPEDVMMNHSLVKELAEVAKDTALLHGIQMRIHETPNSSEVRNENTGIFNLNCSGNNNCIHAMMLKERWPARNMCSGTLISAIIVSRNLKIKMEFTGKPGLSRNLP